MEPNATIIKIFDELINYYGLENEPYKVKAFAAAKNTLMTLQFPISYGINLSKYPGIGKSSQEIINEYLSTGKVQRLEDLRTKYLPRQEEQNTINSFLKIYGVGEVKARELYNLGYRSIDQLIAYPAPLNDKQKEGLRWYYHLIQRIPRSEMDIIKNTIAPVFSNGYTWEIVGSYRRQMPTSGDIDILIREEIIDSATQTKLSIDMITTALRPYLVSDLASGPTKYMGIFKLSDQYAARRIDIRMVKQHQWPYALLYFTGSANFNILCRKRAQELGCTLNEYELLNNITGQSYPASSEADIFALLRIVYLEPYQRTDNVMLTYIL